MSRINRFFIALLLFMASIPDAALAEDGLIYGNWSSDVFSSVTSKKQPIFSIEGKISAKTTSGLWEKPVSFVAEFAIPGNSQQTARFSFSIQSLRQVSGVHVYKVSEKEVTGTYTEYNGQLIKYDAKITKGQLVVESVNVEQDDLLKLRASFWFHVDDTKQLRTFEKGRIQLDVRTAPPTPVKTKPVDSNPSGSTNQTTKRRPYRAPGGPAAVGCGGVEIGDDYGDDDYDSDDSDDSDDSSQHDDGQGCGHDPILDGDGDDYGDDDDDSDDDYSSDGCDDYDDDMPQRAGTKYTYLRNQRRWRRQWSSFVQFGIPLMWIFWMRVSVRRRRRREQED